MRRIVAVLALTALAPVSTVGQWLGVPAWNSPLSGPGITVSADYGRLDYSSDTDPLEASAFGARGSFGFGKGTLALGVFRFDPAGPGALETITVFGAQGAYRVIGGDALPFAVNVQGGVSRHGPIDGGSEKLTNWLVAIGVSRGLMAGTAEVEPYLSVSNRWHTISGQASASEPPNFGFVVGANVTFGTFGLHLAYDSEKDNSGGRFGIFGIGAHVRLRAEVS